jgi:RND family efflux transporter MFP subunit
LDTATTQREGAQAQRDQAVAGARQSGLSHSFTRVTAPFDGRVLQTLAEAGDLAVPGKPLLILFAPTPLRATVQVPASRVQAARGANAIVVQVDDGAGTLRAIAPIARVVVPSSDPVSQTTEWRLELAPGDSTDLLPGQQVRVRFTLPQSETASQLLVPQAAIVRRGELTAVYVVANGAFSLRAVRLGADRGAEGVEVLAGIKSGDAVALDPNRAGFANAVPAAPAAK